MTYRWLLLTTLPLLTAVLPSACAKQNSNEDAGNAGGANSIFTGTGSTATVLPGGTKTDGSFNPIVTGAVANTSVDGTSAIDSSSAQTLLSDAQAACNGWTVEAEAQPAIIEFVIDISGSMKNPSSSTGGRTKWEVTRDALNSAIASLPASAGLGITFYPNMTVNPGTVARPLNACVNTSSDVAIAAATAAQVTSVQDAINSIQVNGSGATPTFDAYANAVARLRDTQMAGNKYIVLITDGQPTVGRDCIGNGSECNPDPPVATQPIVDAIGAAKVNDGISTFVVGSPGSERSMCTGDDVRSWLSAAATAGTTATPNCSDLGPNFCHFDLTQGTDFGVALTNALLTITNSLLSCDYIVPASTPDKNITPGLVNMIYQDGKGGYFLILPQSTANCDKGWDYTDATLSQVRICGSTCGLFQNNANATLTILFGCTEKQITAIQ